MRRFSARQLARIMGITVLVILFSGIIAYSARLVRYPLDGKPTSEFTITKLSLTHEVERTPDGKFTNPYAGSSVLPVQSALKFALATDAKPIVVAAAPGFTLHEMTAKSSKAKPAPSKTPKKKAPSKKAAPKKPAPKKPAAKPSKPKACPT